MTLWNIRPGAPSTVYNGYTVGAGASMVAAVDPGPTLTHDDGASFAQGPEMRGGDPGHLGGPKQGVILGTRPELTAVSQVKMWLRSNQAGLVSNPINIAGFIRVGGDETSPLVVLVWGNTGWTSGSVVFPTRPGGGVWSVKDILDPTLEIVWYVSDWAAEPGPQIHEITSAWLEVTGTAVSAQTTTARTRGTKWLRYRRRPAPTYGFKNANLSLLDNKLGDEIRAIHPAIPNYTGAGAQSLDWQGRLLRTTGYEVDMDKKVISTLQARDIRRDVITFMDSGVAVRPGPTAYGVARADIGTTRLFTRNSLAWGADLGGVVRQVGVDEELLSGAGMGMFRPTTNYALQSSFRNSAGTGAFVGWTKGGTGVGGSAIGETNAGLWFDPDITPRAVIFTAGTPHTTDLTLLNLTTASVPANTIVTPWFAFRSSDGVFTNTAAYRVQRGFDNKYWDGSAWQVAVQTLSLLGTGGAIMTKTGLPIPVGTSATTLTLTFLLPSGGTSGRTVTLYHAQISDQAWRGPIIVTDGVAAASAQSRLLISNNQTARFWQRARGTAFVCVMPTWDSSLVAATGGTFTFTAASCVFDANNSMSLFYSIPGGIWTFRRRSAGVNYDATKLIVMPSDSPVMLAMRWAGASGEYGMTPLQQSMFVDGVKGTVASGGSEVVSVPPTQTTTANAALGGEETTANTLDGFISNVVFTQQVLTDNEIAWVQAGLSGGGFW
jgi:hypothetical protein